MKLTATLKPILIVFVFFAFTSCEKEEERVITEKEVPQAVLQAFANYYPDATVYEYSEEIENGQKYYEISFEFQGRKIDITYKPDGKVAEIETTISAEELPDNITAAISKEFQQFSIEKMEKIDKEENIYYEVKLLNTKDEKRYELLFSDAGKLIEKELIKKEVE